MFFKLGKFIFIYDLNYIEVLLMKKFFFISITFLLFTGCAQNLAFLGPAYSIVKTGGVQQALVSESVNYGVKKTTGKNVREHMFSSITEEEKLQD